MSLRTERGQALVITLFFMTALFGMAALVMDVGSWYREQRQAQSTTDSAALAAAQALPDDPANGLNLAVSFGNRNGGGISPANVTIGTGWVPNDTVTVKLRKDAPGFFSKVLGIDTVQVHAEAAARADVPAQARWVAPIVVNITHPLLSGPSCPCFTRETTLPLGATGAPGAFDLLNLDKSVNGAVGAKVLAQWIDKGFDQYLPLGGYYSEPGAKWNDAPIQQALRDRYGSELLFPVYDRLTGTGANATYRIVAWVGFHLESVEARGQTGTLTGYFTRYIADGIQSTKAPPTPDLGVRSIALVG